MDQKPQEHQQAHDLYFQTDLTQQQIADILNVNRKTLYLWIKNGRWQRIKYTAAHAPSVLVEQYYHQLSSLNRNIAMRADQPWPTKEESEIIRKLTQTIKQVRNGKNTMSECMEVFERFTDKLRHDDYGLTAELLPHMTDYISTLTEKGRFLNPALQYQEELDDKEYEDWLAQQEKNKPTPPLSGPALGNDEGNIPPAPSERIVESPGAQNGASGIPPDTTEPLPTANINENDNADLSTKNIENVDKSGNQIDTPSEDDKAGDTTLNNGPHRTQQVRMILQERGDEDGRPTIIS